MDFLSQTIDMATLTEDLMSSQMTTLVTDDLVGQTILLPLDTITLPVPDNPEEGMCRQHVQPYQTIPQSAPLTPTLTAPDELGVTGDDFLESFMGRVRHTPDEERLQLDQAFEDFINQNEAEDGDGSPEMTIYLCANPFRGKS
ncbi:MAG: hypothetical protein M1833_004269 [Piccolia ochrophora]|nr:MAG: hypothetical protein M1833_004269 [Piccolia ochrophora]